MRVAVLAAVLVALSVVAPARAASAHCSQVLLLSAYPAEIRANLALLHQDAHQPRRIGGHAFFSGTLEGRRVTLALTGIGLRHARSTAALALSHLSCVSAVAFSGTAGGKGPANLGDVVVPDRWTLNDGTSYQRVNAKLVTQVRMIARQVSLERMAAVNVGPCACDALGSLHAVPLPRTPHVLVGGAGTSYDLSAEADCTPAGGALQGCDPCPPSTVPAVPTTLRMSTTGYAKAFAPQVTPPVQRHHAATSPYLLEDEETAAVMAVATAHHLPFLGFRGISDTDLPDMLWVSEYLVYQQLAADNSAAMARAWIKQWRGLGT